MVSVFVIAAVAASNPAATAAPPAGPAELERRCYAMMARLAEADDPQVRSLGFAAASYFLGRLDARGEPMPAAAEAEPALVARCGDALEAGGHDFRRLGEALAKRPRT